MAKVDRIEGIEFDGRMAKAVDHKSAEELAEKWVKKKFDFYNDLWHLPQPDTLCHIENGEIVEWLK